MTFPGVRFKEGVLVREIRAPMAFAWMMYGLVFRHLFGDIGWATITSHEDGRHGPGSLHPEGFADDIRTWNLDDDPWQDTAEAQAFAVELRASLGKHFDVVVEPDHIHVEFDPEYGG